MGGKTIFSHRSVDTSLAVGAAAFLKKSAFAVLLLLLLRARASPRRRQQSVQNPPFGWS